MRLLDQGSQLYSQELCFAFVASEISRIIGLKTDQSKLWLWRLCFSSYVKTHELFNILLGPQE